MKVSVLFISSIISGVLLLFSFRAIFPNTTIRSIPSSLVLQTPKTINSLPLGRMVAPYSPDHDANGFRNADVPTNVDVIAIGDSQTWGTNAIRAETWPAQYGRLCGCTVYNAGMGGFGPAQYYQLTKSFLKKWHPRLLIVAFYFGNDLVEAYNMTYSVDAYSKFREKNFHQADRISAKWSYVDKQPGRIIRFGSLITILTPALRRMAVNWRDSNIEEGLRLAQVYFSEIHKQCEEANVRLVIALIPTKENVYRGTSSDPQLTAAVSDEDAIRKKLKEYLLSNRISFVDLLPALMAHRYKYIYPPHRDGHPTPLGYKIIAQALKEN